MGFHSSLIPDNSREAATARLPWAPQIFRARVTGFGQVFMSTDWSIKLYCTVLYGTVRYCTVLYGTVRYCTLLTLIAAK